MNDFICVTDKNTGLKIWVRRSSIIRFSVYDGITTIIVGGTNDQANFIWAVGDLTEEIIRGE